MMHARVLGRALTITTGLGAVLILVSPPIEAPGAAFAILVASWLGAYWMSRRGERAAVTPTRRERDPRVREEARHPHERNLETWARRSEERSGLPEGHNHRVAGLAVLLARELGLDEPAISDVRRGALLHDIGMLGVPRDLLRKPGPLSPAEREIVEQHPTIARDILLDDPLLEAALAIPYSHHERWDGEGYPLGLAGQEIPLAARLFAVVDHWEVLTTDRPFRRAWPKSAALGYLRCSAGTIFEPRIVEAFLRVLERAHRPG
jgi:HD-GYP domain-containing protein (c-di-GMP phosphodiesterase class II)